MIRLFITIIAAWALLLFMFGKAKLPARERLAATSVMSAFIVVGLCAAVDSASV